MDIGYGCHRNLMCLPMDNKYGNHRVLNMVAILYMVVMENLHGCYGNKISYVAMDTRHTYHGE